MNKPMIEQSERGITLNKSLAWSIFVAVIGGGFWIGVIVTDTQNGLKTLGNRQSEDRSEIAVNRNAISRLRSSNARVDQRLLNIESGIERTEKSLDQVLQYLRNQQD